jgi:hypothetical protein
MNRYRISLVVTVLLTVGATVGILVLAAPTALAGPQPPHQRSTHVADSLTAKPPSIAAGSALAGGYHLPMPNRPAPGDIARAGWVDDYIDGGVHSLWTDNTQEVTGFTAYMRATDGIFSGFYEIEADYFSTSETRVVLEFGYYLYGGSIRMYTVVAEPTTWWYDLGDYDLGPSRRFHTFGVTCNKTGPASWRYRIADCDTGTLLLDRVITATTVTDVGNISQLGTALESWHTGHSGHFETVFHAVTTTHGTYDFADYSWVRWYNQVVEGDPTLRWDDTWNTLEYDGCPIPSGRGLIDGWKTHLPLVMSNGSGGSVRGNNVRRTMNPAEVRTSRSYRMWYAE